MPETPAKTYVLTIEFYMQVYIHEASNPYIKTFVFGKGFAHAITVNGADFTFPAKQIFVF